MSEIRVNDEHKALIRNCAERELIKRGGLHAFVHRAWPILEPGTPFVDGWHLRVMCQELEKVTRGETEQLIINVPPGFSKSTLVCVLWPAWEWTIEPGKRWMMSSYDPALVLRDALRTKRLVESEWYQTLWPDTRIARDKREVSDSAGIYYTTAGGLRFSAQIGSRGVGWHGHTHVIDDPHKPLDVGLVSGLMLEKVWMWLGLMATRGVPGQPFRRVVIMQRLHERDMTGMALASGGWRHVCLPMHGDPDRADRHPADCRNRGELLCPALKDETRVAQERRAIAAGGADPEAQHEQRPTPPGGRVFHRAWWQYWTELPLHLTYVQSWDFTFGANANSWVVGQLWATTGVNHYLIDQLREQTDYPGMKQMVRTLLARYPETSKIYIEGAALGKAVLQEMSHEVDCLEEVSVTGAGSKLVRARVCTGIFADGHVWWPDPDNHMWKERVRSALWVYDMTRRFESFTGADADVADEIDCTSQVLAKIHGGSRFAQAMMAARVNR